MFITFEGPEGAGKSTALLTVAERLREAGHDVVATREPGAGEVGAAIREVLLHGADMPPATELLLFLADRANHVATVIRPALEAGKLVLCDRFADSTLVYQGLVRDLDEAFVRAGNAFATDGLLPDLTLLFDLPAEQGLARLTSKDRMDAQPLSFHQAVRAGFQRLAQEDPDRWTTVDASRALEVVAAEAFERVNARLNRSQAQGSDVR